MSPVATRLKRAFAFVNKSCKASGITLNLFGMVSLSSHPSLLLTHGYNVPSVIEDLNKRKLVLGVETDKIRCLSVFFSASIPLYISFIYSLLKFLCVKEPSCDRISVEYSALQGIDSLGRDASVN